MSILITGGAGFIGSHTCVEMLNSGYDVVVVDNLDNSSSESLDRVEKITGKKGRPSVKFLPRTALRRLSILPVSRRSVNQCVSRSCITIITL